MSQSDNAVGKISRTLEERELKRWNLLAHFQDALEGVFGKSTLEGSWSDPKRWLAAADYLSLYLFGLFNPVVRTIELESD